MIKFLTPLLFLILFDSLAMAKPISLSSLPPEIQKSVSLKFPNIEKQSLTPSEQDELIRFMHSLDIYEQVQLIDSGEKDLTIKLIKTKKVKSLHFSGLSALSESEAGNLLGVKAGDVFLQNQIIEGGEKIRQAYKNLGYQNAVVEIEVPTDAKNEFEILVEVKISENNKTLINSIKIESPNTALNALLEKQLAPTKNYALTDIHLAEIQQSLRQYLNLKHFVRADIAGPDIDLSSDESQAQLKYKLDKTDSYSVSFNGNKKLSTFLIQDVLDFDHFFTANPNIGPELANKIKNYYLSQGYARVEVNSRETEGKNNFEKRVLLDIEEGPRVAIQKFTVNGKFSRDAAYYEKFLSKNSSALVKEGFYNKDDVDTGFKNLILQLQNEGFLLSKITSSRTQYNHDKNQVTVVVNLDEGPLTQIDEIKFTGNNVINSDLLLAITRLQNHGPLKLSQIDSAIANLKTFYHESGYIEMLLSNEKDDLVTYDSTNTKATLNFKIFEGPKVKVASIIIQGNSFTKDYVILKELDLEVGDIVTPTKIDESITRLQKTGFFSAVDVKTLEEKTNTANRTLIVSVTERDPGVITVGAGATSERTFTVRGYTGISYRNVQGTGRGLSLRLEGNYNIAQIKYLESKITFGYLEPYLMGTRLRGRINISRSKAVTDYDLHQVIESNQYSYNVEKDFTSHVLGVYTIWGLTTIRKSGYDDSYPYAITNVDIATTGPTLDLDFRDDPLNPTSGTFTRWTAEYANPILGSTNTTEQTIDYIRSTLSFTHYLRLSEGPVVFANNLQGGYLKNLSGKAGAGVPYDLKGFTLGGQSTVRGFEAGTSDVFPNKTDLGSDQYSLTTAAKMFLIKSELRFPVYGKLGGTVFYDGGSVVIDNLSFSDSYRDSAGFGVHFNTPVGPIKLEWAWKLDRRANEEPMRFHFSVGTF